MKVAEMAARTSAVFLLFAPAPFKFFLFFFEFERYFISYNFSDC